MNRINEYTNFVKNISCNRKNKKSLTNLVFKNAGIENDIFFNFIFKYIELILELK